MLDKLNHMLYGTHAILHSQIVSEFDDNVRIIDTIKIFFSKTLLGTGWVASWRIAWTDSDRNRKSF